MRLRFNFSYRVAQVTDLTSYEHKIGQAPEKYLMSSLLKNRPTTEQAKELKTQTSLDVETDKSMKMFKRTPDYAVQAGQYMEYGKKHPHGKVHIFNYQNVNFTIAGSQWEHVPNRNVYKLLLYTMPDAIMIQVRPDHILRKFDHQFTSTQAYVKSITRSADEIMPPGFAEQISTEVGIQQEFKDEFAPYQLNERIQLDKVATLCHYAKRNNIPIILADTPEMIYRESLTNQMSLVQLQNLFQQAARLTPQHPDILPNTPLNVAQQIFPHIFLKKSDEFMSTLIEYFAAKQSYKRIFGLVGNMQSDSINALLENRSVSHLSNELTIPKIKRTIFKELTCEDLVERHAILDVMYFGKAFREFSNKKIRYHYYLVLFNHFQSNQEIW